MNTDKTLKIGFNTFDSRVLSRQPAYELFKKAGKGVDFVLCHFDPQNKNYPDSLQDASDVGRVLAEDGIDYIANYEFQNFLLDSVSPDGHDWANRPDGTHRLDLPEEYVARHAANPNFIGIMHDELEHAIVNRNLSIRLAYKFKKDIPVFPVPDTDSADEQFDALNAQLKEFKDDLVSKGGKCLAGEHVLPVMFHIFASNGIIPNFKSQKESYSDIMFACAAGAALEYGTPLYNCVDTWFRNTQPGHSPEEMYANLVFAYYAGVNRAYVESSNAFIDGKEGGMNEYGRQFIRFSEGFRGRERDYDVSDYRPETGIIRFDDTYWGQWDRWFWKNILFGNPRIKPSKASKEWIRAWHVITHGETSKKTFLWDRIAPWALRKHRSFATFNSAAVFDDNAGEEVLSSLKLCFLCGTRISEKTLAAVSKLVKENGLTAVTSPRYAPKDIKSKCTGGFSEIADGKGRWIVTNDIGSNKVRKAVSSLLGNKNEIRLTFRGREIRLAVDADGNGFKVISE